MLIADPYASVASPAAQSAVRDALQLAVGAVWLLAAIGKARAPGTARAAIKRLIDGPPWAIALISRVAVPAELGLAVTLLVGVEARVAAIASIVLFTLFAIGLARLAIRDALGYAGGSAGPGGCGCFGQTVVASRRPQRLLAELDTSTAPRAVARNLALAVLAVAVAFGV
jgi:uncharacterized membrane protein YphA (DoxX/SURF4 family)